MPIAHPTSEDRQWRRRRRKGSRTGGALCGLRLRDLQILFRDRWGDRLPDDDAGRGDAELALHHIAPFRLEPRRRMREWLAAWAPWMTSVEAAAMIECVIAQPRPLRADTLAAKLNLHAADRARLKITTIGAVDQPKEKRIADRKERDRLAKAAARRARGVIPITHALSRRRPWLAEGISRAAWYRRKARSETTTSTALRIYTLPTRLSQGTTVKPTGSATNLSNPPKTSQSSRQSSSRKNAGQVREARRRSQTVADDVDDRAHRVERLAPRAILINRRHKAETDVGNKREHWHNGWHVQ